MEKLIYETGLEIREKLITPSPFIKPEETAKQLEEMLLKFAKAVQQIKLTVDMHDNHNTAEINSEIIKICEQYQSERVSGQWYVEQTGLNKVAKLLGGEYKLLTKIQRAIFRDHCMDNAHIGTSVKSWWFYLNCA